MKKICVIGNFSGRNAGDAAILEGLLSDVHSIYHDVLFLIPTINKRFVETTYSRFPIKAVPLMPWNFSLKIFGIPIYKAVLHSDLVLVTDAILWDRKLWNPLHNYLSTMSLVLPLAKKRGIPIVLYNVNLGPITSNLGKKCLRRVLDSSAEIIVRDNESIDLLHDIQLSYNNIKLGADCALNIPLPSTKKLEQIKRKEGILEEKDKYMSFNVNSYLDHFIKGKKRGINADYFANIIADTMDRVINDLGKKIVFVITQPMDLNIAELILSKVRRGQDITLVSNKVYSHNELAAILARVEVHIGMRLHTLILATASCTPTIGIMSTPKIRGYMKTIEQDVRLIEFGQSFTSENLFQMIKKTWAERHMIKENLRPIVEREKRKASESVNYLKKFLCSLSSTRQETVQNKFSRDI